MNPANPITFLQALSYVPCFSCQASSSATASGAKEKEKKPRKQEKDLIVPAVRGPKINLNPSTQESNVHFVSVAGVMSKILTEPVASTSPPGLLTQNCP